MKKWPSNDKRGNFSIGSEQTIEEEPMTYHHLTRDERLQIYTLLSTGNSHSFIAKYLKVSASTISREISRNKGLKGYRPKQANEKAVERRYKASNRPRKLVPELCAQIEALIREELSPEQISGRLKLFGYSICAERLYQYIWADKRKGGTLHTHLRRRGKKYNRRSSNKTGRGHIPGRVDIKERPAIVEAKTRFGDWEADTIIGVNHRGAILSLVDRKSKYTLLVNLVDKTASEVLRGIKSAFKRLPRKIAHTMTFDNGKEFACHAMIAKFLKIKCFFATPYCSWERGLNEHTNGLVRQYYPKKTDFTKLKDSETQWIEDRLNNRPRKMLDFLTPREVLMQSKLPLRIALQS